jgi:hypothetical protein
LKDARVAMSSASTSCQAAIAMVATRSPHVGG